MAPLVDRVSMNNMALQRCPLLGLVRAEETFELGFLETLVLLVAVEVVLVLVNSAARVTREVRPIYDRHAIN